MVGMAIHVTCRDGNHFIRVAGIVQVVDDVLLVEVRVPSSLLVHVHRVVHVDELGLLRAERVQVVKDRQPMSGVVLVQGARQGLESAGGIEAEHFSVIVWMDVRAQMWIKLGRDGHRGVSAY